MISLKLICWVRRNNLRVSFGFRVSGLESEVRSSRFPQNKAVGCVLSADCQMYARYSRCSHVEVPTAKLSAFSFLLLPNSSYLVPRNSYLLKFLIDHNKSLQHSILAPLHKLAAFFCKL